MKFNPTGIYFWLFALCFAGGMSYAMHEIDWWQSLVIIGGVLGMCFALIKAMSLAFVEELLSFHSEVEKAFHAANELIRLKTVQVDLLRANNDALEQVIAVAGMEKPNFEPIKIEGTATLT